MIRFAQPAESGQPAKSGQPAGLAPEWDGGFLPGMLPGRTQLVREDTPFRRMLADSSQQADSRRADSRRANPRSAAASLASTRQLRSRPAEATASGPFGIRADGRIPQRGTMMQEESGAGARPMSNRQPHANSGRQKSLPDRVPAVSAPWSAPGTADRFPVGNQVSGPVQWLAAGWPASSTVEAGPEDETGTATMVGVLHRNDDKPEAARAAAAQVGHCQTASEVNRVAPGEDSAGVAMEAGTLQISSRTSRLPESQSDLGAELPVPASHGSTPWHGGEALAQSDAAPSNGDPGSLPVPSLGTQAAGRHYRTISLELNGESLELNGESLELYANRAGSSLMLPEAAVAAEERHTAPFHAWQVTGARLEERQATDKPGYTTEVANFRSAHKSWNTLESDEAHALHAAGEFAETDPAPPEPSPIQQQHGKDLALLSDPGLARRVPWAGSAGLPGYGSLATGRLRTEQDALVAVRNRGGGDAADTVALREGDGDQRKHGITVSTQQGLLDHEWPDPGLRDGEPFRESAAGPVHTQRALGADVRTSAGKPVAGRSYKGDGQSTAEDYLPNGVDVEPGFAMGGRRFLVQYAASGSPSPMGGATQRDDPGGSPGAAIRNGDAATLVAPVTTGVAPAPGSTSARLAAEHISAAAATDLSLEADPRPAPTARSVLVKLPAELSSESVHLRFLQRGGHLQVRVASPSESLATEIREHLPAMLARLQQAGFSTERPATPGLDEPASTSHARQASGDGHSQHPGNRNPQDGGSGEHGSGEHSRQQPTVTAHPDGKHRSPSGTSFASLLQGPAAGFADSPHQNYSRAQFRSRT